MYLEAKQRELKSEGLNPPGLNPIGTIPPSNLPDLAAKELRINRAATETLARELSQKHSLSETAAKDCAKDILRYQETHGEKLSSSQMTAMVQISRELDKRDYPTSLGQASIEYLRRRDADLQFREFTSHGKDLSGFKEFPHKEQRDTQPHVNVKSYETPKPTRSIEENAKVFEMDMSL